MKTENQINLTDDMLISQGRLRRCYRHPTDHHMVVKVPSGPAKEQLDANLKEYRGHQDLVRRCGELSCISRCFGFSETNFGRGLLCESVRDEDGAISKTIWDIIIHQDDCDLDYIIDVTGKFCLYLTECDTRLFDLNLKNIALSRRKDGTYQAVALDLKGRFDNSELIPFSSYIGFLAKAKMARRTRQLLERIVSFHAKRLSLRSELSPAGKE